jgi:predicted house-cleaning noncanonical NTP pyrophosphatase (MazG superfamily)
MKRYNKLVRDKIPAIIEAEGKTCTTRVLNDEEYLSELIKKLGEEYAEFKEARNIEELADIAEVVRALAEQLESYEILESVREEKAEKRGRFNDRIFLEGVQ